MNQEIKEAFEWRYATKKFQTETVVDQANLDSILESIRLAPTSMGLQPFHVYVIDQAEIREKLYEHSKQSQVKDASHLLVFAAKTDLKHKEIVKFVQMEGDKRGFDQSQIDKRIEGVERFVKNKEGDTFFEWSARQTYIALGFALSTAALLKVDACPMEGFKGEEFDRVLKASENNLKSVAMLTIGFRHPEDSLQFKTKVRKSAEELFTLIS